jgi:hypothetical protein
MYTISTKSFAFKNKSHRQVLDILNKEIPIQLNNVDLLINNIHMRYPLISKAEISLIVMATFQSFRDFLVMGKILNFKKIFFGIKLFFSCIRTKHVILSKLEVKIKTPREFVNF